MRRRTTLFALAALPLVACGAAPSVVGPSSVTGTPRPTPRATARPEDAALAIGDSLMDGRQWVLDLAADLGWHLINTDPFHAFRAAIGGSTLMPQEGGGADLLTYFDERVGHWTARHAVVMVGSNDWGYSGVNHLTPDGYGAAWEMLMQRFVTMWSHPDVTAVAIPPSDRLPYYTSTLPSWASSPRQGIATLNMRAATAVRAHGARWVSLEGFPDGGLSADGIHPSATGEQFVRRAIAGTVAPARGGGGAAP